MGKISIVTGGAAMTLFIGYAATASSINNSNSPWYLITLLIFSLIMTALFIITGTIYVYQSFRSKYKVVSLKKGGKKMLIGIGAFIILAGIIGGSILIKSQLDTLPTQPVINRNETRTIGINLITQINQFIADRQLSKPSMPTSVDQKVADDWMQQNRQYDAMTTNLFVSKFRQQVIDLAYIYSQLGVINDDEFKELLWFSQPSYPSIDWTLQALEKYNTRLN